MTVHLIASADVLDSRVPPTLDEEMLYTAGCQGKQIGPSLVTTAQLVATGLWANDRKFVDCEHCLRPTYVF